MKYFSSKYSLLIIGDFIAVLFSVHLATVMRWAGYFSSWESYLPLLMKAAIFSMLVVLICFFIDLYNVEKIKYRKEMGIKILLATIIAAITIATFSYFTSSIIIGRGVLFIALCISLLLQIIWHVAYSELSKIQATARKVLILGTGPLANNMGNILVSSNNGFALAGYVNCIGEPIHVPESSIVGNGDGLFATAMKERVHKIVVSLSERRGTLPVREVLDCKLNGIDVVDGPSFYEQVTGRLLIESMNPSHLIFSDGFRLNAFSRYIKRLFDIFLALVGIILSFPLFVIVPLLIKIDSRGTVLFKQKRIGEGEKFFIIYKYRTMIDGAEKESGPVWSQSGDKRITRMGKFLRKTRIDELPQLFNVLYGDMSFIGPRPERYFFVESLKKQIPYYSERHCLKPGITGWAQVRYEYGDSMEDAIEKLRYDLYYVKYQSFSLDLLIVLDTIKVVLLGRGGR
jgi:sugar transferase (PEP-CTERM system associated)